MKTKRTVIRNERGFSMFATLLLLLLMLTLGTATMMSSLVDVKSTQHFKTGMEALAAAEAGLFDGLSVVNHKKVKILNTEAVANEWDDDDGLADLLGDGTGTGVNGDGTYQFPNQQAGYWVGVSSENSVNPAKEGWLFSLGFGPADARRLIKARIREKEYLTGFGAIFLTNDDPGTYATVQGTPLVDGNDHLWATHAINPDGPVVPGISTQSDSSTDLTVQNVQSATQVIGAGGPMSVRTNGVDSNSIDQLAQEIRDLFLPRPRADVLDRTVCPPGNNPCTEYHPISGVPSPYRFIIEDENNINNETLGCPPDPPVVLWLTSNTIHMNGTVKICGMVITDAVDLSGTAEINGMMLMTSDQPTRLNGTFEMYGTLWTKASETTVRGTFDAKYSSDGISMADEAVNNLMSKDMPTQVTVVSWEEVPMDDPDLSANFSLPSGL